MQKTDVSSVITRREFYPGIRWVLVLFASILFATAYSETLKWLWHYWVKEQNWQFLVLVAFAYMLWEQKSSIARLRIQPGLAWGTALLVLGCVLLVAGQVSGTQSLRELSLIISIFALVQLLFGTDYMRRLFWPLAYLVLMTSLPSDLLELLRGPLKLISATVATDVLQGAGYAVFREGTFLYLPHMTLEVADTCSGLNQLVSSIALGIPIAYLLLESQWKRLFIILLSIALSLVMNWVRVVLIALWHYDSAKEVIHGPYGIYELPFIFLIGVALTLAVALAMSHGERNRGRIRQEDQASIPLRGTWSRARYASVLMAVFVLGATSAYLYSWEDEPVYLDGGVSSFGMEINGITGKPLTSLNKPFHTGLAHTEYIMNYPLTGGKTAKVYVGYFHSQNQEEEIIDYRYNWLHESAEELEIETMSTHIKMKKRLLKRVGNKSTILFSYDVNGRNIVDPSLVKLATLIDALLYRNTNGAVIIIEFNNDTGNLSADELEFAARVMDRVSLVLPRV